MARSRLLTGTSVQQMVLPLLIEMPFFDCFDLTGWIFSTRGSAWQAPFIVFEQGAHCEVHPPSNPHPLDLNSATARRIRCRRQRRSGVPAVLETGRSALCGPDRAA